jgi:hypothetical protein
LNSREKGKRGEREAASFLREHGFAAPGFMNPEGIVCYHVAAACGFKKTLENNEAPKGQ